MLFKNLAILSLAALVAANQAAPVDNSAPVVAEAPQDISKLKHKCPQHTCPKPKVHKLTKNITKTEIKTVTKQAAKCQPTHY
ncbi:hypothetical protein CJU90_3140 [Yarrowia sp. C11]|nr:hypothetical protein CKK34_4589 [Yarrowia sp. E02]KAG5369662.1 hypothetical protein CJU90_3140 [Yarrowia sp. C11]